MNKEEQEAFDFYYQEALSKNFVDEECSFPAKLVCGTKRFRDKKDDQTLPPTKKQIACIVKNFNERSKTRTSTRIPKEFYERLLCSLNEPSEVIEELREKLEKQNYLSMRNMYDALQ